MKKLLIYLSMIMFIFTIRGEYIIASMKVQELSMEKKYQLLTDTALKYDIPPEILKAVASVETGMMQFKDGKPLITDDGGIGMMQITHPNFSVNEEKLKYDTAYNIEIGAKILKQKWELQFHQLLPKINDSNPKVLENWYFAIMAYNGASKVNDPNYNEKTYQERVYTYIENHSLVQVGELPQIGINYDRQDDLKFSKMRYYTDKQTVSTQMFELGDSVYIMNSSHSHDYANLRKAPNLSEPILKRVPYYSNFKIVSGPYFQTSNDANQFVLYEVRNQNDHGFISSSNLRSVEMNNTVFKSWNDVGELVSKDKVWSIRLNAKINPSTINAKNVYLEDENGNGVFSKVTYDDTKQVIQIVPDKPYRSGARYTLKLKYLQSINGTVLQKPIKMTFNVK